MSQDLRVEFKVPLRPRPTTQSTKPEPPAPPSRRCRPDRRARNLALAYWIDAQIRSGEIADLASAARLCGVSRARITVLSDMLGMPVGEQELALRCPADVSQSR